MQTDYLLDPGHVDATLPFLNRYVRGLVEFQRLTGCRPGEACAVRRCDIDETCAVWLYTPKFHKTAHRGKGRTVAIGPKVQVLLKPFFTSDANAHLFNPRLAVAECRLAKGAARATPRYPSHMKRNADKRVSEPKRCPSERYTTHAFGVAVR